MIGKTLSHYKILEQIGAGGMGEVYRAHDERLGRDVALKLLPAETLGSESARRALANEARTASALNHPNICTIHDVGEADGQFFVAMEFVEGKPLARLIPTGGLPEEMVVRYAMQIADALAHAEQRGIVHRDLKSANVVVTPEGRAKVLDFGLAQRVRKEVLEEATRSKVSIEASRGIAGTLAYMAPETLRGEAADARSDIWALGVVLHEMASGELPFQGATGFELSAAILREPPRALLVRVPAGLRGVIQRCLAKDPAQRYQRAGEVKAALEATSTGLVVLPATEPHATFWRNAIFGSAGVRALAALLLAFNVGGARERVLGRGGAPRIQSIAVLPLVNLSGDPEQEYFADGMTEALITELAQISGLKKVTSRTSVMQYKGTRKSLPQIAKELNVDAVVEGSVQRSSNRVGITVQLIEAATDRHLWAKPYERDLRDVLTLQREVARTIADEIRVTLTPLEQSRLASTRPVNPEAYQLCLKGNFQLLKTNEEAFRRASEYYEQAIERDPTYAPAYVGLSMAYTQIGSWFGSLSHKDIQSKAKEAAVRAVQLDDKLAEAHLALGAVKRYFEWDWPGAESEFTRGMELNPNSSWARIEFANHLTAMGRFEESIAAGKQTLEIDPLSPAVYNELGWALKHAGQYQAALEQYRKGLELDPDFVQSHELLLELYLETSRYQEALAEIDKLIRLAPGKDSLSYAAYFDTRLGRRAEALRILNELKKRAKQEYVSPVAFARIFVGLGETDQALNLLEKAYADRDVRLVMLKVESAWAPLRSNTRFQALLRRMNFPH